MKNLLSFDFLMDCLDNSTNGFLVLNLDKEVIYVNKSAKKLFAAELKSLLGNYIQCKNTLAEIANCQNTSKCKGCILNKTIDRAVIKKDDQMINSLELNTNEGTMNVAIKIRNSHGYIILEILNIAEESREANILLRMSEKSRDSMYYKDLKLRYLSVNNTYSENLNIPREDILFLTDRELLEKGIIKEEVYEKVRRSDYLALENGYYNCIEEFDGRYFSVSKEYIDDGILCITKEITGEVLANKRAEIDSLTGLNNRSSFSKTIKDILENKIDGYYLVLIDMDNLRIINNTLGHLKGDEYLKLLGEILLKQVNGTFYRVGGDEFAALINGESDRVDKVLKNIFKELEELNTEIPLTVSVGSKKLDISLDYKENYQEVDKLLYESKNSGKNRYIIES